MANGWAPDSAVQDQIWGKGGCRMIHHSDMASMTMSFSFRPFNRRGSQLQSGRVRCRAGNDGVGSRRRHLVAPICAAKMCHSRWALRQGRWPDGSI